MRSDIYIKAELLQNTLIAHATSDSIDTGDYENLRSYFLSQKQLDNLIPDYIKSCRDLRQFWQYIKRKYSTYAERREFIWNSFSDLLNYLKENDRTPSDEPISRILEKSGIDYINEQWKKALERRLQDPEGAITTARTLLESICKYILEKRKIKYDEKYDLPKLYYLTAESLNLAPQQHTEEIFKQILGGCQTVVNGLGSLRNKTGDAHGKGQRYIKPSERHAKLAVNLAGTVSVFLLETYEFNIEKKT
jgi:hypothetical protein